MIAKTHGSFILKKTKNQYPAYALKSDDGNQQTQYPKAYAANHSDDGEKLKHWNQDKLISCRPGPE